MNARTLYIRPSHALSYDNCAFAYYLKYILGVKQDFISANLPFGTAVHESCTGYILAQAKGDSSYDPVNVFRELWGKSLDTEPLEFSSTWSADDFTQTGLKLADLFPAKWEATGYTPLIDSEGPVVERRMQVHVSDDLILTGQPDVVAMDSEASVIPLDIKTSAQAYGEEFLYASEQLTDYQLILEGNAEQLGLDEDGVTKLGFFEGLKRKVGKTSRAKGPEFLDPLIAPKRTSEQLAERKQKLIWMREDIIRGRFPKRPRMAYNTPCSLCEFREYCLRGDRTGLVFPEEPQQSIALEPSSMPLI